MPFRPTRRTLFGYLVGLGLLPGTAISPAKGQAADDALVARDGALHVRLSGALRQLPGRRFLARVRIPRTSAPVLGPGAQSPGHRLLWRLVSEGRAAGNHGDLYENRDRGHSELSQAAHPQLTRVVYDDDLRKAGIDYGLAGPLIFDAPLIGNSSTALKHGPLWRSLPRLALTETNGALALYQNYLAGQIHVYPEHLDHDPEHGDLIPANTPFFLVSQGSSGSDQSHLEALAMILAALRPETKTFLWDNQLLAPTVQMIFRRSLARVRTRNAYLSGLAHPSAIPHTEINLMRKVGLAQSLTPRTVPPMVRLAVLSETPAIEGRDYFGEGLTERLFDTPVAIARLWRSQAATRSMVVSATARDVHGRIPEFTWRLLRGDPARTRIEPLDSQGTRARITVDWQAPRPVPGARDIQSSRVDIGVFARVGELDSMPGLISVLMPHHETRTYQTGSDGPPRIASRDFRVPEGQYADPILFPRADWRDAYRYGASGGLLGWDRYMPDRTLRFDAEGRLITPDGPRDVRHVVDRPDGKVPHLRLNMGDTPESE